MQERILGKSMVDILGDIEIPEENIENDFIEDEENLNESTEEDVDLEVVDYTEEDYNADTLDDESILYILGIEPEDDASEFVKYADIISQYKDLRRKHPTYSIWLKGDYGVYVVGKIVDESTDLVVVDEEAEEDSEESALETVSEDIYSYSFPEELTEDDIRAAEKYFGLKFLDTDEEDVLLQGSKEALKEFGEKWLGGYELHPDYLYKESDDINEDFEEEEVDSLLTEDLKKVFDDYYTNVFNDVSDLVNVLSADPTFKLKDTPEQMVMGTYGKWLVNKIYKGNVVEMADLTNPLSDLSKDAKETLTNYNIIKNKLPREESQYKDIFKFKTLQELKDFVKSHEEIITSGMSDWQKKARDFGKEAQFLGSTENFEVYSPSTWEASKFLRDRLGHDNAEWCTGQASSPHYFNSYTSDDGKLFIFLHKKNTSRPNNKYQLCLKYGEFREFKNANNNEYRGATNNSRGFEGFLTDNPELIKLINQSIPEIKNSDGFKFISSIEDIMEKQEVEISISLFNKIISKNIILSNCKELTLTSDNTNSYSLDSTTKYLPTIKKLIVKGVNLKNCDISSSNLSVSFNNLANISVNNLKIDGTFNLPTVEEIRFENCQISSNVFNKAQLFAGNTNLKKLSFVGCSTDGELHIPVAMFAGDRSLEEIDMPFNITQILPAAFKGCDNLKKVYIGTAKVQITQDNRDLLKGKIKVKKSMLTAEEPKNESLTLEEALDPSIPAELKPFILYDMNKTIGSMSRDGYSHGNGYFWFKNKPIPATAVKATPLNSIPSANSKIFKDETSMVVILYPVEKWWEARDGGEYTLVTGNKTYAVFFKEGRDRQIFSKDIDSDYVTSAYSPRYRYSGYKYPDAEIAKENRAADYWYGKLIYLSDKRPELIEVAKTTEAKAYVLTFDEESLVNISSARKREREKLPFNYYRDKELALMKKQHRDREDIFNEIKGAITDLSGYRVVSVSSKVIQNILNKPLEKILENMKTDMTTLKTNLISALTTYTDSILSGNGVDLSSGIEGMNNTFIDKANDLFTLYNEFIKTLNTHLPTYVELTDKQNKETILSEDDDFKLYTARENLSRYLGNNFNLDGSYNAADIERTIISKLSPYYTEIKDSLDRGLGNSFISTSRSDSLPKMLILINNIKYLNNVISLIKYDSIDVDVDTSEEN